MILPTDFGESVSEIFDFDFDGICLMFWRTGSFWVRELPPRSLCTSVSAYMRTESAD